MNGRHQSLLLRSDGKQDAMLKGKTPTTIAKLDSQMTAAMDAGSYTPSRALRDPHGSYDMMSQPHRVQGQDLMADASADIP